MKQRTLYQVRVTQEIPFCDYDEDGEETKVSSGRIEEYVAGRFSAEHNAKLFAEALENKELEENTRSWDTVTGIKYQVAVIPIMRGKEIAGFKTEYSALIPG